MGFILGEALVIQPGRTTHRIVEHVYHKVELQDGKKFGFRYW